MCMCSVTHGYSYLTDKLAILSGVIHIKFLAHLTCDSYIATEALIDSSSNHWTLAKGGKKRTTLREIEVCYTVESYYAHTYTYSLYYHTLT